MSARANKSFLEQLVGPMVHTILVLRNWLTSSGRSASLQKAPCHTKPDPQLLLEAGE